MRAVHNVNDGSLHVTSKQLEIRLMSEYMHDIVALLTIVLCLCAGNISDG